jgi:hypothetical protein
MQPNLIGAISKSCLARPVMWLSTYTWVGVHKNNKLSLVRCRDWEVIFLRYADHVSSGENVSDRLYTTGAFQVQTWENRNYVKSTILYTADILLAIVCLLFWARWPSGLIS